MNTPYTRTVLPNGVKLITIPMPGVNSVATSVMVGVGSRYEDPHISGISHFLEHMVFKGTTKYPTTDEVNIVEKNGGLQNAYTDVDITNYHNKVLSTDWKLGLEVNTQLALHPLLAQSHIDMERNVIIEEMKRYEDEPSAKVEEIFHHLMYPDTPLGRRIIGTQDSLGHVEASLMQEYHKQWYTADRITVVMAGNIVDPDGLTTHVEQWYSALPKIVPQDCQKVHPDVTTEPKIEILTKPEAQQANLEIGLHTFARGDEDRFAWNVFNVLMGVSFTSRLFREIREKKGLCYHIRSSNNNWTETGYWSIFAGVATEKVSETIMAIMTEITKVVQSGVSVEEVEISKKRIKTMLAFRTEDPEFQNEYYGRQELFGDPVVTLPEYLDRIDRVSTQSVNALVRKYLGTPALRAALVWNKPANHELVKLFKV